MIRKRKIGVLAGWLAASAALQSLIACSDGFTGQDCKASRTCKGVGGDSDGGEGGSNSTGLGGRAGASDAGAAGVGVSDEQSLAVEAISPEHKANDVEPEATVVIRFNRPLDPATVTSKIIKILDGQVEVPGTLAYADSEVTFTPLEPLSLLVDYSVQIATELTDADGAALAEAFASAFTTRDGSWHTAVVPTAALDEYLPLSVPIASNGDTLLAWPSQTVGSDVCSTSVRWFNRGEPISPVEIFSTTLTIDICYRVVVGVSAEGTGAVVSGGYQLNEENQVVGANGAIHEFRSGEWAALGSIGTDRVAVNAGADGKVSYVAQALPGTRAYTSTEAGLSGEVPEIGGTDFGYGMPTLAFDAEGDGWAAWQALALGSASADDDEHEILVARYTVGGGWKAATPLPGSLAPSSQIYQRGQPALTVDKSGGAMVLWIRESNGDDAGQLVASRYAAGDGWTDPVLVSGEAIVVDRGFAPALVFDGVEYVAAWPGSEDGPAFPYTARFDLATGTWSAPEARSETAIVDAMPRLGVDAHRNLLMTWVASRPGGTFLFYTRYRASTDEWSEPMPVTDEPVGGGAASGRPSPMSVNARGLAALMWGVAPDYNYPATINYASFH